MAGQPNPTSNPKHAAHRWRAILRLTLGQLQVIGATAALVLLVQGGVSAPAIWAAALTAAVTLTSILLFRLLWRDKTTHQRHRSAVQCLFHWPPKM